MKELSTETRNGFIKKVFNKVFNYCKIKIKY